MWSMRLIFAGFRQFNAAYTQNGCKKNKNARNGKCPIRYFHHDLTFKTEHEIQAKKEMKSKQRRMLKSKQRRMLNPSKEGF